jgi:hypothetical protein
MQQAKELFINSVRQVRLQGHSVVPTVVLYKDKKFFVGFDALENGEEDDERDLDPAVIKEPDE